MTEGRGERATGTPNIVYNLSSVLFHALEGGASYDTYIEDAERAGDQELASFFRQVRDEDSTRAEEARRLLAERTSTTTAAIVPTEEGMAAPTEGLAAGAPRREVTAGVGEREIASAPTGSISEAGRDEPDVPPIRPEEPPPPGTGVEER